jgi:hypothetical protein
MPTPARRFSVDIVGVQSIMRGRATQGGISERFFHWAAWRTHLSYAAAARQGCRPPLGVGEAAASRGS